VPVDDAVRSAVEPSENTPMTVSCSSNPTGICTAVGETRRRTSVRAFTVTGTTV
jgi:hypothetical protein